MLRVMLWGLYILRTNLGGNGIVSLKIIVESVKEAKKNIFPLSILGSLAQILSIRLPKDRLMREK